MSSLDMREALFRVAEAVGLRVYPATYPSDIVLAVQGYVETHNDTIEELAYARNALRDLSEKVLQLEEQVAGLRNRPAPQRSFPVPRVELGNGIYPGDTVRVRPGRGFGKYIHPGMLARAVSLSLRSSDYLRVEWLTWEPVGPPPADGGYRIDRFEVVD